MFYKNQFFVCLVCGVGVGEFVPFGLPHPMAPPLTVFDEIVKIKGKSLLLYETEWECEVLTGRS